MTRHGRWLRAFALIPLLLIGLSLGYTGAAHSTTFTTTVPGTSITLPDDYPEAGGVAIVMVGVNGNVYYQFSDPANAFRGFNNRANRDELEGNPFTVNDPIALDCGFSSCRDYFGGDLAQVHIRFSAYDGDTQVGGFDFNNIDLVINGYDVGNWSGRTTERTNTNGTQSLGFENGFGNNVFNTGWFDSTNPALLDSLLDTGTTTIQVRDDDPNDNYWDFQRGPSLDRDEIRTVAPGYTIEKDASAPTYGDLPDSVTYTYTVSNIGSVAIRNLQIDDDQIDESVTPITCNKTTILPRPFGDPAGPDSAVCSVTYQFDQDDIDAGTHTNIASATGDPDEGVLGAVSDTETVTGPAANPSLDITKDSVLDAAGQTFGNAGTTVPYVITATNDGNVTLTDVLLTDDLIPSFSCTIPQLEPGESDSCSVNYTVTQNDVDTYAANPTPSGELKNVGRGTATAARGADPSDFDELSIPGPLSAPDFTLAKTALAGTYSEVGETLQYNVEITNTGNLTFPDTPLVTDSLPGATVTCPTGPVLPTVTVVCQVSYDVDQDDINDGQVDNTVTADITVGGININKQASATVTATRSTGLTLVKRLAASSRTSFDDDAQLIEYEYVLTNTGNVTLTSPSVVDDVIDLTGSVSCPAGDILPEMSMICTATYSTLQADLNAGEVTNIATASATTAGAGGSDTVTSTDETLTVPAVQNPGLTLAKSGADPASFAIGETITYTFTVTNSGNTDIAGPITVNDNKIGAIPCLAGPLLSGTSDTCTADYQLTTGDVAAGAVTNVASATDGTVTSPDASATISNAGTPAIEVTKQALTNPIGATDTTVRYRFTVENTGDTQIIESASPITITDDKINVSPFICAGAQPSVLNPGDTYSCERDYTSISQEERDAGEVVNTVSGTFPFNTGTGTIQVTSQEFVETTPITENLSFTFAKEQDGPDEFLAVNDIIDYTFTIVNDGNVTISGITITDDLIPSVSCPITDLAPGGTETCTAQYVVKQEDVDAGSITNVASATGTSDQGSQFTPPDATETSTLDPAGDLSSMLVSKTADVPAFAAVGETITYTIDVFNDGTKTLTNTVVTDILDPMFSCTIPTLAPNTSYDLCRFTYTVTQDDINAGVVNNTASATNPAVTNGPDQSSVAVPGPTRNAALEIEKVARSGYTNVGDTVTFDIRVRNTGNVTMTGVSVEDSSIFAPAETCTVGDILPGFDEIVCSLVYTVDQDDIDAGSVDNLATVTGTGADGTFVSETATETADGPVANPAVSVDKVPASPTFTGATDSFDFTFTVTNTGNVTLTNLELVDVDGDGETFRCDVPDLPPAPAANSTTTCVGGAPMSFTKNFDQSDVNAASYTNTATVTGESLVGGTPVTDSDEETVTGPIQTLTLSIDKRETFGTTFASVGEVITYEYDVTNTSNITVTGTISVSDSVTSQTPAVDVPVSCPAIPISGLAPGDTLTCMASYTITQEDLDIGTVTNSATASVSQRINGEPDPTDTTSAPDDVTVNANQQPTFSLAKAIKAGSATTFTDVGDQVTFEYTVTNTGNQTLTSPITVSDDQIVGTTTCGPVPLAPGDSITCELVWTATQTAINAGEITNIGTASSPDVPLDATDTFTTDAVQEPGLAVEKNSTGGTFEFPGTISYEYIITNTGNTEIDTALLTVNDSRIPTVTCPPGGGILEPLRINPAASYTCTADYTLTLQDIQLGEVTNLATVTDGTTTSPQASETVPAGADPSLNLVKTTLSGADFSAVGDRIEYEFTVTNTSVNPPGASFSEPVEIVDDKLGGTFTCFTPTPTDLFNAGEVETCTAEYFVTQEDLDAGEVLNEAIATTVFAPSSPNPIDVVSAPATETTAADGDPELTVTKSVTGGPSEPEAGETIQYTILTENTGNQTLTQVMTSDTLIPTLTCTVADGLGGQIAAPANVILAPGEVLTCVGDYEVTQDDVDNEQIVNTASSMGNDPSGGNVPADVTNTFTALDPADPELTVLKEVTPEPGVGDPAFSAVGETVTFAITVTNTGNITVDSISVADIITTTNPATPASCAVGTLAPNESSTICEFQVVITQDDIDVGTFDNTATATGTPRSGGSVEGTTTITVDGPDAQPAYAMSKIADVSDFDSVGDIITYTYTVGNAGNVTLFEQPVITDDKIGTFNCGTVPAAGLPPLSTLTCTATYAVTQNDVDAGFVTNIATANSSEVPTPAEATETVDGTRTPGVSLVKTPSITADAAEGDVITYTYTVTNTGNTRLFNAGVTDAQTSAAGTNALTIAGDTLTADNGEIGNSTDAGANGSWDVLAPGDVAEFTASYTVTQADVDAGNPLTNDAAVSATGPPGTTPPNDDASVSVPVEDSTPALEAVKVVSGSTGMTAGDTVSFTITIENTGNVTLDAPVLVDTLTRTDGTPLTLTSGPDWDTVDTGQAGQLDVGETWTYTASYQLDQDDIDAGGVANQVLATSAGPDGTQTQDRSGNGLPGGDDSPTVFSVPSMPAISAVKTVTSTTTTVDELVTFDIVITNDGNVTLSNVNADDDTLTRADGTVLTLASGPSFQSSTGGSPSGTLIPGESATFVASYRLQQADIDAGGIANTATVSGTPPVGAPVTDVSDNGDPGDGDNNPTVLEIAAAPALSITKALAAGEPGNYDTLDQEIAFEFTIVNDGNVTLSGPFTVADALIEGQGNAVTCPAATLAPGEEVICNGSYFVTQDDLDDGSFTNAATASDGTTTSPEDTVTVPALQNPSMEVVKEAEDVPPATFDVGLEVEFTYTVTNDGNVTLEDEITVSDNLIDTVTCDPLPTGGLIPGDSLQCLGTYTVTADDVTLFTVTNLASSTSGPTVSPLVSETIPNNASPSISVVKTAEAGATFAEVGDTIDYTFDVTNDGTQAFSAEVLIFDNKIPGGDTGLNCPLPAGDDTLSVGQTISCTFTYPVTQDDLDAGEVVNEAFAQTSFGDPGNPTPVTSAPTTETVDADEQPALTLGKTSAPNPAGPVGSIVTYTLVATNTGNQTLNTVAVTDERLPTLVCEAATLARGEVLTCMQDYVVTQEDIDNGGISNTASVLAQNPSGQAVGPVEATENTGVPAAAPGLTVAKTANPAVLGPVGSFVTFNFEVENTGNTTLQNIAVDDALDTGPACVIPLLAPDDIDNVTCSFMLEVTQDMIDAGEVTNDVDVMATDLLGNPTSGDDSITVPGPAREPSLEATKIATTTGQAVDEVVTYLLSVENTGNVTLTNPRIADTMTRNNGTPTGLTTPFVLVSGDDGDGELGVDETWIYSATHVITQSDINAGGFINTATVTADGPPGTATVDDVSDNGNDGDGNTTDDPTPFVITSEPQITTVKAVTGTPGTAAGETVSWSITARNTGNVDITNVSASDTLTRADGTVLPTPALVNTSGTTDLGAGEEIVWTLTYVLQQADVDAGGLLNSATVMGEAPNGDDVSDVSADDDPFDGNNDDDPTALVIPAAPGLETIKTLTTAGVFVGDQMVFAVTVRNTGNVTLSSVAVTDTMTRIGGGDLTVDSVTFVSSDQSSPEGTLLVGETATYEVLYTLQLADIDAGGVSNLATATATTPLGATLSDISGGGVPTPGPVAAAPANTLTKSASDPIVLFPTVYQVTFTMSVENTGNITQSGYQIADDLSGFEGSAEILRGAPFGITVRASGFTGGGANGAYDGDTDINTITGDASLEPGETGVVEIDVVYQVDAGTATGGNVASVTSAELATPTVSNEVTVPLPDSDGDGIPDSLEGCSPLAGNDRDGDGICDAEDFDPTGYFYCEDDGRLLPGGQISVTGPAGTQTGTGSSNNIRILQDGTDGQFVFFVTRPGTYTLSATYPALGAPSSTRLSSGNIDATSLLPANPASLGGSEVGNSNVLNDFSAAGNTFYTSFTFEAGDPFIINNNLPMENCQGIPDILATKQADRESAVFGESVNFTLSFSNNTSNTVANMNLVDILPAGMLYTPNSAAVDGVPLEPTVNGLRLTWAGLTIAPSQTINVTLAVRVVANGSYGELVNRTFMTDAAGNQLSNTATAVVRIEPEHVFDCSDIIGKVYDDKNQNGYQDQGEPGLPGVRLATVRGYLITTDEHGRYHVPCAELPKAIGSNFTLKLDTRTLPSGYRVTTENPRVIRVTAGKFAKLNFGATLSNVVDIDLTARAFTAEGRPVAALGKGIDRLVAQIRTTPSVLRLSYILRGEEPKEARARLKLVEQMIRQKWRGGGRYKLNIERTIKRAKGAGQ